MEIIECMVSSHSNSSLCVCVCVCVCARVRACVRACVLRLPSMSNFSTASLAFSEGSYGNNSGLAVYVAKAIDPTLCWDDITWLKKHTCLPVIVKGVLNGIHADTHTHTMVFHMIPQK